MSGTLRQLIDAWRGRDLLSRMLDEFRLMLADGEWMFETVGKVLRREEKPETVHDEFFARDQQINAREKDIRRRIVEHLGLRGETDVNPCLVLMSVVKDAERIGDYAKNIYEVACLYPGVFETDAYMTELESLRTSIEAMFAQVARAITEADGDLAARTFAEARRIRDACDDVVPRLFADTLPTPKAVAYALLSRHYKRVAAHLANICTSLTGPVYEMDHTPSVEARVRKTYGMGP